MFVGLSLISWYKNKHNEKMDEYIPMKEFFSGIKNTSISKLYSTILLARRVIIVILFIFGETLDSIVLVGTIIAIQVIYLANLIIVRPYKETKSNIIEVTNE